MAWPCTRHKINCKSSANRSQSIEITRLVKKNQDSTPWVPNASKAKINLTLLQDSMAISFSMQSPASYFHKHVAISAHINVTIYLSPYLVVLSTLPCNWTHTYVISQGTPIPWWIPHNMKPDVTHVSHMFQDQDIMYITLKSTFTKIYSHAIINSQSLIIILQLAPTRYVIMCKSTTPRPLAYLCCYDDVCDEWGVWHNTLGFLRFE